MKILSVFLLFISLFAQEHIVMLSQYDENITQAKENNTSLNIPKSINDENRTLEKNVTNHLELYLLNELSYREDTLKLYALLYDDNSKFLWFNNQKHFTQNSLEIIKYIKKSLEHGLNPELYHKKEIFKLTKKILDNDIENKDEAIRRLDILFTDAYISLAHDLYYGFTNWKEIVKISKLKKEKFEWLRSKKSFDFIKYLTDNIKENNITKSLENLAPHFKEYKRLQTALKYYRNIQKNGGFVKIPEGKTIRYKDHDARIPLIRKRLFMDDNQTDDPTFYDTKLLRAVKDFQQRFSLRPDGSIGQKTIKALNITVSEIIDKIILNLERYRWMPKDIDKTVIEVNIPSFLMKLKENEQNILSIPVVIGKKERPTPVFNSKISSLVLNPYWHVPKTIVKKDLLKRLKENPDSINEKNMHIYDNWKMENEIDVYDVNWNQFTEDDNIPFVFVQDPGIHNPLGKIKFQFSNPFAVFMHDTPHKNLFSRNKRYFSSGCIRLEKPMKLLRYIIKRDQTLTFNEVKDMIDSGNHSTIVLNKRIPIIIKYITVEADENGKIRLYDDIYDYDRIQLLVLKPNSQSQIKFALNKSKINNQ